MGVHATYCLICGLPVQHDHYVATDRENSWAIYRRDNKPPGHFPFGSEHEWLTCGVAVSDEEEDPHLGSCEDGALLGDDGEEYYVGDGHEDYTALHAYCWNEAGRPFSYNEMFHYRYGFLQTFLVKYQEQLFEFQKCVDEGDGWMLVNPSLPEGARNKERIARILATPKPLEQKPANVEQLLATDAWAHKYPGDGNFWRYRDNMSKELDKSGFPELYWVQLEPGETPKKDLETFEIELYTRLQGAGHAVALATLTSKGKQFFCLYARNVEACDALVAELCPVKGYEVNRAHDPEWKSYYEELYPHIEYVPLF